MAGDALAVGLKLMFPPAVSRLDLVGREGDELCHAQGVERFCSPCDLVGAAVRGHQSSASRVLKETCMQLWRSGVLPELV